MSWGKAIPVLDSSLQFFMISNINLTFCNGEGNNMPLHFERCNKSRKTKAKFSQICMLQSLHKVPCLGMRSRAVWGTAVLLSDNVWGFKICLSHRKYFEDRQTSWMIFFAKWNCFGLGFFSPWVIFSPFLWSAVSRRPWPAKPFPIKCHWSHCISRWLWIYGIFWWNFTDQMFWPVLRMRNIWLCFFFSCIRIVLRVKGPRTRCWRHCYLAIRERDGEPGTPLFKSWLCYKFLSVAGLNILLLFAATWTRTSWTFLENGASPFMSRAHYFHNVSRAGGPLGASSGSCRWHGNNYASLSMSLFTVLFFLFSP